MQNFILNELKEVCSKIKNYPADKSIGGGKIADTILNLVEYSIQARKDGILSMEQNLMLEDMTDNVTSFMVEIFYLLLDGTKPESVEKIGLFRYISDGDENPFEALSKLIILVGARSIQNGENPRLTENELIMMVPPEIRFMCVKKFDDFLPGNNRKSYEDFITVHFEESGTKTSDSNAPSDAKAGTGALFEPIIKELSDREIQLLLKETENIDLRIALNGIGRKTAERIFHNMPEDRGRMIIEEMDHLDMVPFVNVSKSREKILDILYGLFRKAEIYPDLSTCKNFRKLVDLHEESKS